LVFVIVCTIPSGVQVEFILQPKARVSRIASAEQLTMHQLLDQYAAATKMKPGVKQRAHAILQVRGDIVSILGQNDIRTGVILSRLRSGAHLHCMVGNK
jgi:hypothetical protein